MLSLRIGHGFDVHRLAAGRRLVLGGIEIPFEKGLEGHSDADVVLHAVMDALLGAAGLSDIGVQFPPSDPAYRDADSADLLTRVTELVRDAGFRSIINVDVTVIAERPRLQESIPRMRQRIADILEIDAERINIKATTTEGLGYIGRGEGIAAAAVCLISRD